MSSTTDAFQRVIEQAVEAGVRRALNVSEPTGATRQACIGPAWAGLGDWND
jgi:hypothetical protein